MRSVGSYRHFRRQGCAPTNQPTKQTPTNTYLSFIHPPTHFHQPISFVVHGGLNLGLDYMLYRGSPQKYHAEFGVLLRYPPRAFGGQEERAALTWRELHLLYRLIGVRLLVMGVCLWGYGWIGG